jgi:hypothetical protein
LTLSRLEQPTTKSKRWKLAILIVAALALAFAGFVLVLEIHWRGVERQGVMMHLRSMWLSWKKDGSPEIFNPARYGYYSVGTTYVYTASVTIDGEAATGLLAFRRYDGDYHGLYVVTRAGQVLEMESDGRVRRILKR